jgi:DNA uptake protein ComE-like DNA-binding protein
MFTIETDAARTLVHARASGFLNVADVAAFFRQEQEAVQAMGYGSGDFVLLFDAKDAVIQSQEVVAEFMAQIVAISLKARRVAVVREAALARMQAQRIVQVREDAAIFATVEDAEAWLFAADPAHLTG